MRARWHVGSAWSVEDDALYDLGDFATRDEAVAAGMEVTKPGDHFYVIHAELGEMDDDDPDYDPDYGIPFADVLTDKERIDAPSPERAEG